MNEQIERNRDRIGLLCRQHHVRRLAAFGSIVRSDFDPVRSDADFLVEFEPLPAAARLESYLALRKALGELLARPVDLVEDGAIRNPYLLQRLGEQQQTLYAA